LPGSRGGNVFAISASHFLATSTVKADAPIVIANKATQVAAAKELPMVNLDVTDRSKPNTATAVASISNLDLFAIPNSARKPSATREFNSASGRRRSRIRRERQHADQRPAANPQRDLLGEIDLAELHPIRQEISVSEAYSNRNG
jgi:hypothetical protein